MPLVNVLINSTTAGGGGTSGFTRGNAPPPPALSFDYLVVGGGDAVFGSSDGGGGGGFLSGSTSMSFNDTLTIEVGDGGTAAISDYGKESYISSSLFGHLIASGAIENGSGLPQGNPGGLGGPYPIGNGGGGGASQAGVDGIENLSGRGGYGLQWLDGNYYAGGGGGAEKDPAVAAGAGVDGGGDGYGFLPNITGSNGAPNTGGGCGGGLNGTGGSGVVIIRYSTGSVNPPYDNAISGGTRTVTGGYVYHTFTGSGEFTYRF